MGTRMMMEKFSIRLTKIITANYMIKKSYWMFVMYHWLKQHVDSDIHHVMVCDFLISIARPTTFHRIWTRRADIGILFCIRYRFHWFSALLYVFSLLDG